MSEIGQSMSKGMEEALAFAKGRKDHGCVVHIPEEIKNPRSKRRGI